MLYATTCCLCGGGGHLGTKACFEVIIYNIINKFSGDRAKIIVGMNCYTGFVTSQHWPC